MNALTTTYDACRSHRTEKAFSIYDEFYPIADPSQSLIPKTSWRFSEPRNDPFDSKTSEITSSTIRHSTHELALLSEEVHTVSSRLSSQMDDALVQYVSQRGLISPTLIIKWLIYKARHTLT